MTLLIILAIAWFVIWVIHRLWRNIGFLVNGAFALSENEQRKAAEKEKK